MKYYLTVLFLLMISFSGCSKDIAENEKKSDTDKDNVSSTDSGLLLGEPCSTKADCKESNEYCFIGRCLSEFPECSTGADCTIGNACVLNTDAVCDGCLGKNLCFVDSFCDGQDVDLNCDMGTVPRGGEDLGTHDLVEQDSSFSDVGE